MTARANFLQNREPERSRVGPTSQDPRESGDDVSETIKTLLAGIEPRVASEALARAETLGRLPPAQQILLRCALAAASETFKKTEIVQNELAKVKERQRRADTDLLAESQAFSRRSALAEAQVAGLSDDLAASVAANREREARFRSQRRYLWLALAAIVSAGVTYAFLFARPAPLPVSGSLETDRFAASGSKVELQLSPDHTAWQSRWQPENEPPSAAPGPGPGPGRDPVVEQSLKKLDGALARVPLPDIDSVLRDANQWLLASRASPCFVRMGEGEISLLVRMNGKSAAPLSKALGRCAEAVEHVTQ